MQHSPKPLEMIAQLIRTPSISCVDTTLDQSNYPLINILANWLDTIGFTTTIMPIDNHPNKANLIATYGTGQRGLVLAGHTDTVPYDENAWQSDPFTLTTRDEKLFGLGTADMKSFFALAITAINEIDLQKLQQPLILLATADEETSMSGAKAIAKAGLPGARFAIVGEPTSIKPIRMHKGIIMESIRITGLAGHSSNPSLGHNALDAMHRVMTELMQWRDELAQRYQNPLFVVPTPTLNFGAIRGGDNPNRICGHCQLHIDIRPLPGMTLIDLHHELIQRLSPLFESSSTQLNIDSLIPGTPAFETPKNSAIVQAVEQLTQSEAGAVAFATEAPYYNQLGIESVILGPGNIDQAHQPNEYLNIAQIKPTVKLLRQLIEKFCL